MIALLIMLILLLFGSWFVAVLDQLSQHMLAGRPLGNPILEPLRRAAHCSLQQRIRTEAPDWLNWRLSVMLYAGLAVIGMAVVPIAPGQAAIDLDAGIVLWGAVEALTVVVVFLHGWSPNSQLALTGAYRYVAIGLPVMLLSMFLLIAAALPAESLNVSAVVEAQNELWNVLRQPLGLPLFLLLGLSLSLRGPLDYADSADLAGGSSVEDSGGLRLAWQCSRLAMLVSFAAMAATVFLGGYLGPFLPGPLWLLLKTMLIITLLVPLGHVLARMPVARMLTLLWTVLLPLSFAGLVIAGMELLL